MELKKILTTWAEKSNLENILGVMAQEGKMKEHLPSVMNYILEQVSACLSSFGDINDDDDVGYYVAIHYVELKARWIQMNLRLSYQAVTTGEGDPEMLLKAAATSQLLGIVEPYVSQNYVGQIQNLLTQPVFSDDNKNAA